MKEASEKPSWLTRRVQAALLVLLVLLAAVLAVGVWSAASLYRSGENRYIGVVIPLQASVRQVVLGMVQEESGVRGYMITGDRKSLAPYFDGRRKTKANLGRMAKLTRDRPSLAARLVVLGRDPLAIPVEELRDVKPVATMLGGQWAYEAE